MKDYIPLMVSAISTVALIAAAFLGAWLGRNNEHAKWLREQRLQVYSEWLGVTEEIFIFMGEMNEVVGAYSTLVKEQEEILKEVRSDPTKSQEATEFSLQRQQEAADERNRSTDKEFRRLRVAETSSYNRVHFLASTRVREAAVRLDQTMNKLVAEDKGSSENAWKEAMEDFRVAVRKEMGPH